MGNISMQNKMNKKIFIAQGKSTLKAHANKFNIQKVCENIIKVYEKLCNTGACLSQEDFYRLVAVTNNSPENARTQMARIKKGRIKSFDLEFIHNVATLGGISIDDLIYGEVNINIPSKALGLGYLQARLNQLVPHATIGEAMKQMGFDSIKSYLKTIQ